MTESTAVKSADRALLLLEFLSTTHEQTPGDIAEALGIPRSSLHGLLHTMLSRGWLVQLRSEGIVKYAVGPLALSAGAAYLQSDVITQRVAPMLNGLSAEFGETVHLGELLGMQVMYLDKRDARHPLRLVSAVGVRLPAYATALGKVLLADLDDTELALRLTAPRQALTRSTLTDEADLLADISSIRERGYAIDDQESTDGVRCFAVALGSRNPRRFAVSCSIPIARLDDEREQQIVSGMRQWADRLDVDPATALTV